MLRVLKPKPTNVYIDGQDNVISDIQSLDISA
jgi:hypothetical protein